MSDPRYDPRFQRGWDGELVVPPPAAPEPPAVPAAAARPSAPPPPVEAPVGTVREAVGPDPSAAEAELDDEPDAAPARNPYRIALGVVGVVLTVAGGGMLWQLALPTAYTGPSDYVLPQLETTTAPWIALAGLIAIVATIALGAFRRR